ncbi:MAG TPA: hypothetical protein VN843_02200, partial [Anaerolineales bacterium]|nr:hypothetical protein [Anaerolineales bacterium]
MTANSDHLSHFGRRISLFLQTLVLRSILSSEQEHRQERISVGMMRLWPIGSTRGEEANEFEIGNLHESGGRALVSTLLAVIVTAAAGTQSAPAVSSAEARKAIQVGYAEWAKARVALDVNTIERMLAPDFYVQTPDQKHTRQEFIDSMHSLKITRYDASVLTVEPRGND